jgi:hypothetical protein
MSTPALSHAQLLDLIDLVQSMPRSSPKTTSLGPSNMPLFVGMERDPEGAWVHWYDIVKEMRRMIEAHPDLVEEANKN